MSSSSPHPQLLGQKYGLYFAFLSIYYFYSWAENIIGLFVAWTENSCVFGLGIGFGPWVLSIGIYRGLYGMFGS